MKKHYIKPITEVELSETPNLLAGSLKVDGSRAVDGSVHPGKLEEGDGEDANAKRWGLWKWVGDSVLTFMLLLVTSTAMGQIEGWSATKEIKGLSLSPKVSLTVTDTASTLLPIRGKSKLMFTLRNKVGMSTDTVLINGKKYPYKDQCAYLIHFMVRKNGHVNGGYLLDYLFVRYLNKDKKLVSYYYPITLGDYGKNTVTATEYADNRYNEPRTDYTTRNDLKYCFNPDNGIEGDSLNCTINITGAAERFGYPRNMYLTMTITPVKEFGNLIFIGNSIDNYNLPVNAVIDNFSYKEATYNIYDDKPLWKQDGENVKSNDNIMSNRMDVVSHDYTQYIDVTVHRKLVGGTWTTLCLPFDVDVSDLKRKEGLGNDIQIATFSNARVSRNTLNFYTEKGIETLKAFKPYLIKYNGEDKDAFILRNISFDYTSYKNDSYGIRKEEDRRYSYYAFVGVVTPTKCNAPSEKFTRAGSMVYISSKIENGSQHLKKLSANGTIKAFRAYIFYPESNSAKEMPVLDIDDALENETTGVPEIRVDGETVDNRIYNLNGQCVGIDAESLPSGIYVRNGKKFVVK